MKREIKFRGVLISTGKWIVGDLVQDDKGGKYIHPKDCTGLFKDMEVIPESVGEFTGLYDSTKWGELSSEEQQSFIESLDEDQKKDLPYKHWKGREIFEGHILRHIHVEEWIGSAYFKEGRFCLTPNGGEYILNRYMASQTKIVGNLFDNPELIKRDNMAWRNGE